jgi:hypothetical protein
VSEINSPQRRLLVPPRESQRAASLMWSVCGLGTRGTLAVSYANNHTFSKMLLVNLFIRVSVFQLVHLLRHSLCAHFSMLM